jgi:HrpA-like RNA helicase
MAKKLVSLPIDPRLGEIMGLVREYQVVIVEAETGAGKTTRLPQAWLALFDGPATITQTRRNAVRWNGRRIADELGCRPGELVGWRLRGEPKMTSASTRLTLMMDQSLVNRIQRERKLPPGLIIIDEAHERSVSIDLALGLVRQYLPVSSNTKVIVTSATIDTEKFSRYFGNVPVVLVKGRVYPVSAEVLRMQRGEHHSQCAARAAGLVLSRFLEGKLQTPTDDGKGTQTVSSGTVLVLLPGKDDITSVMASIGNAANAAGVSDRVQVMACHGESTREEQDAIQAPMPEGTIRFVCGTEVLRNSVTVCNTVGVIDSLQVKRLIVTPKGVARLTKITVSKAEADQGKGRAGRTAPGFYIAVSFGSEYESLSLYPQPAILREPIAHVVLQVAAMGLDVRTFDFIDRPPEDHIEAAIRRLRRVGALDDQERITETGRILLQFPIDPERAKALLAGRDLAVLPEAVIALAVLDVEGFFHRPKERSAKVLVDEAVAQVVVRRYKDTWGSVETDSGLPEWAVHRGSLTELDCAHQRFPSSEGARWVADIIRRQWAGDSQSDFVAIVRAYRAFKAEERRLQQAESKAKIPKAPKPGVKRGPSREAQLRDWCMRHSVNFKRLRMAESVMREIREELANSPLGSVYGLADEREFDAGALTIALASGMLDNLATYDDYRSSYNGPVGTFRLGYGSVAGSPPLVLVGGVSQVAGRRGSSFYLADLAAAVDKPRLVGAIPELVTVKAGLNPRYDWDRDEVVSTTETWFNGQRTESREVLDPDHAEAARLRREGQNQRQWQAWAEKPEIALPDPADESAVVPEIVVCAYGADVETGEPLMAYGVVAYNASHWYASDPWFRALWTRDAEEAQRSREASVSRLEAIRAEAKAAAERERLAAELVQLKQAAEPLRQQVAGLCDAHYYNYDLPQALRDRLYSGSQLPYASDPEVWRQWMADAEALVAEVNATLAAVEAQKAEAARQLAQLTESARSLRDDANELLVDHGQLFSDGLCDRLERLDVDDDYMPADVAGLTEWVRRARPVVDEARRFVDNFASSVPQGVSNGALAALATRFGK